MNPFFPPSSHLNLHSSPVPSLILYSLSLSSLHHHILSITHLLPHPIFRHPFFPMYSHLILHSSPVPSLILYSAIPSSLCTHILSFTHLPFPPSSYIPPSLLPYVLTSYPSLISRSLPHPIFRHSFFPMYSHLILHSSPVPSLILYSAFPSSLCTHILSFTHLPFPPSSYIPPSLLPYVLTSYPSLISRSLPHPIFRHSFFPMYSHLILHSSPVPSLILYSAFPSSLCTHILSFTHLPFPPSSYIPPSLLPYVLTSYPSLISRSLPHPIFRHPFFLMYSHLILHSSPVPSLILYSAIPSSLCTHILSFTHLPFPPSSYIPPSLLPYVLTSYPSLISLILYFLPPPSFTPPTDTFIHPCVAFSRHDGKEVGSKTGRSDSRRGRRDDGRIGGATGVIHCLPPGGAAFTHQKRVQALSLVRVECQQQEVSCLLLAHVAA